MLASLTLLAAAIAQADAPRPAAAPTQAPAAAAFRPDPAWKPLGRDIWFDPAAKRAVLRARVCLNEGVLEHLICLKGTKEHESILATEAPPKLIHAALLLTGAAPGHPVRFEPKFEAPAGAEVAIEVEWEQDKGTKKVDAREWVKEAANNQPLKRDWVFAGSELFPDRRTGEMIYAADGGDLVTVANFASSILDLPYRSSANDADRSYVANPERVPPQGTPVTVYLSPRKPAPAPTAATPANAPPSR